MRVAVSLLHTYPCPALHWLRALHGAAQAALLGVVAVKIRTARRRHSMDVSDKVAAARSKFASPTNTYVSPVSARLAAMRRRGHAGCAVQGPSLITGLGDTAPAQAGSTTPPPARAVPPTAATTPTAASTSALVPQATLPTILSPGRPNGVSGSTSTKTSRGGSRRGQGRTTQRRPAGVRDVKVAPPSGLAGTRRAGGVLSPRMMR